MLGLIALLVSTTTLPPPSLHDLEGHKRVLVLIAPDPRSQDLATQDRLLAADRAGLIERDVVMVHVVGPGVDGASDGAGALRHRLGVAPDGFAVRLIGKDGHVALRDVHPIATARLFAAIDAMPMRRAEVARRGH